MILGQRICIIGPSNSGKSTLALRLPTQMGIPCYHLDQMAHIPGTNWQRRADSELARAQDVILTTDKWIIEGNYGFCMPQRLASADTVIWMDMNLWGCIGRYIKRSLRNNPNRPGRLEKAKNEFSLHLIKYTLVNYPKNREKYHRYIEQNPHLNVIKITSLSALNSRLLKT